MFDVFQNSEDYREHIKDLMIVQTGKSLLIKLQGSVSGDSSGPGDLMSFINYYLVRHDMQYRSILLDIPKCKKKGKYVSYEPGARKKFSEFNCESCVHDSNVNIMLTIKIFGMPIHCFF